MELEQIALWFRTFSKNFFAAKFAPNRCRILEFSHTRLRMKLGKLLLIPLLLAMTACASLDTLSVEPDEYEISQDAPGGMYGSFIGLSPSQNKLAAQAQQLCPNGYKKMAEDHDDGIFATRYRRWDILCTQLGGASSGQVADASISSTRN